jgi:hypothetical protein
MIPCISIRSDAKPADYVFTRDEIEKYINEHAYVLHFTPR